MRPRVLDAAALDPYEFLRDAYLQRRRSLVFDGNPPARDDDIDIKVKPKSEPEPKPAVKPGAFRWPFSAPPAAQAAPASDGAGTLTPAQAEEREREMAQQRRTGPRAELARAARGDRTRVHERGRENAHEEPRVETAPATGQKARVARVWLPAAR